MKIQNEAQLSELLATGLQQSFYTNTFVREFKAGYGIADLVFAKNFHFDKNSVDRSPINNYYALRALFELKDKSGFSTKEVKNVLGIGESKARETVHYLVEKGYLRRENRGSYSISIENFSNPIKSLVAIEVKLRDWKQGILQARRYKTYTDECYLAILSEYEKNIDYNLLNRFDIGLILFSPTSGEITIKKKPSQNKFLSIYSEIQEIFAKEYFLYRNVKTSRVSLSM